MQWDSKDDSKGKPQEDSWMTGFEHKPGRGRMNGFSKDRRSQKEKEKEKGMNGLCDVIILWKSILRG